MTAVPSRTAPQHAHLIAVLSRLLPSDSPSPPCAAPSQRARRRAERLPTLLRTPRAMARRLLWQLGVTRELGVAERVRAARCTVLSQSARVVYAEQLGAIKLAPRLLAVLLRDAAVCDGRLRKSVVVHGLGVSVPAASEK